MKIRVTSFLIGRPLIASGFNSSKASKSFLVPNMTQKQLDVASLEDFSAVQWESNQVTCQLQERFSLIVKGYNHSRYSGQRSNFCVLDLIDACLRTR